MGIDYAGLHFVGDHFAPSLCVVRSVRVIEACSHLYALTDLVPLCTAADVYIPVLNSSEPQPRSPVFAL